MNVMHFCSKHYRGSMADDNDTDVKSVNMTQKSKDPYPHCDCNFEQTFQQLFNRI